MAPHTFWNLAHIPSGNMGLPLGLTSCTTRHTVGIWFTLHCPRLRFVLLVEVVALEGCGGRDNDVLYNLANNSALSSWGSNNICICYLHIWSNDAYNKNITKLVLLPQKDHIQGLLPLGVDDASVGLVDIYLGQKTTRRVSFIVRWFFGLLHKGFICRLHL